MARDPFLLGHLVAVGRQPTHVGEERPVDGPALEEAAAAEDRVGAPQLDQPSGEGRAARRRVRRAPSRTTRSRCPGSRRCCCPAGCGRARRRRPASARPASSRSVARKLRFWRSRSARTAASSVSPSTPQFHERLSSVPSAVGLAVGLVVLVVVRDEVVEGEAVVGGDEVDRRVRAAPVVLVEIARAGQAVAHLRQAGLVAVPEVAHRVAELAVPLGPQHREVAHLVAALADVPRLGDQLHVREDRVLVDQVEERAQPVDLVETSRRARRRGRSGTRRRASPSPSSGGCP